MPEAEQLTIYDELVAEAEESLRIWQLKASIPINRWLPGSSSAHNIQIAKAQARLDTVKFERENERTAKLAASSERVLVEDILAQDSMTDLSVRESIGKAARQLLVSPLFDSDGNPQLAAETAIEQDQPAPRNYDDQTPEV